MPEQHVFEKSVLVPKNPKNKREMYETIDRVLVKAASDKIAEFLKDGKSIRVYGYSQSARTTEQGNMVYASFYLEEEDGS